MDFILYIHKFETPTPLLWKYINTRSLYLKHRIFSTTWLEWSFVNFWLWFSACFSWRLTATVTCKEEPRFLKIWGQEVKNNQKLRNEIIIDVLKSIRRLLQTSFSPTDTLIEEPEMWASQQNQVYRHRISQSRIWNVLRTYYIILSTHQSKLTVQRTERFCFNPKISHSLYHQWNHSHNQVSSTVVARS